MRSFAALVHPPLAALLLIGLLAFNTRTLAAADAPIVRWVSPPPWTGFADDLGFYRVTIRLATLPTFPQPQPKPQPHSLSLPAAVTLALAQLPHELSGLSDAAQRPKLASLRNLTQPAAVTLALAQLPHELSAPAESVQRPAPAPQHSLSEPAAVTILAAQLPREVLASAAPTPTNLPSCPKDLKFVTSLAADQQGNLWVGSEDSGVFRYTPSTGKWRHFTTKDGLGDDNLYSIAVDHLGRVWVGHLNHGVSVCNGYIWQNYEVVAGLSRDGTLAGPLGERVFKIAVNPADGDVWIATSAGLARYSTKKDTPAVVSASPPSRIAASFETGTWSYYTRAEGLPSDQAQALAFAPDGTLYVGTQCDGIAIASPKDNYATWRQVKGPDRMPTDPTGNGLPTNLINDLLVAKDGTVYAATTTGLAASHDQGHTWQHWRGRDYADKVRGLYGGPPEGWQENAGAWLAEDYITCLAEDPQGHLLIGYRQKGTEPADPVGCQSLALGVIPQDYVTAVFPQPNGSIVIGTYGQGARAQASVPPAQSATGNGQSAITPLSQPQVPKIQSAIRFPAGAQPPTNAELTALAQRLKSIPAPPSDIPLVVVPLSDDWTTRGNWLGRYGKYWACLSAMDGTDYFWGAGQTGLSCWVGIGSHCSRNDSARYWIQSLSTAEPRSLEMPPVYLHSRILRGETTWDKCRRQAEHDDHGESVPLAHEGPNLYYTLSVPSGMFFLSFYNANKDSHADSERLRDYRFSIRRAVQPTSIPEVGQYTPVIRMEEFSAKPELASARERDFWGGTYKRFLVRGPAALTIEIARNCSLNTINAGIFVDDALNETPDPYFPSAQLVLEPRRSAIGNGLPAVDNVLQELTSLANRNSAQWAVHQPVYTQLARCCLAAPEARQSAAATCLYQSHQFAPWEAIQKSQGLTTAREIEKALRWDQHTPKYSGRGRQTVVDYLAAKAKMNSAASAQNDSPIDIPPKMSP